jgi:hypothetical protein
MPASLCCAAQCEADGYGTAEVGQERTTKLFPDSGRPQLPGRATKTLPPYAEQEYLRRASRRKLMQETNINAKY